MMMMTTMMITTMMVTDEVDSYRSNPGFWRMCWLNRGGHQISIPAHRSYGSGGALKDSQGDLGRSPSGVWFWCIWNINEEFGDIYVNHFFVTCFMEVTETPLQGVLLFLRLRVDWGEGVYTPWGLDKTLTMMNMMPIDDDSEFVMKNSRHSSSCIPFRFHGYHPAQCHVVVCRQIREPCLIFSWTNSIFIVSNFQFIYSHLCVPVGSQFALPSCCRTLKDFEVLWCSSGCHHTLVSFLG